MKFMRMVCMAGALALAVSSSAHADKVAPPPAGSSEPSDADIKAFLKFFDQVADLVVADKADCTKMAADVNKAIDDNKALLDKANSYGTQGKQLPTDARNHMMASAKRMSDAMLEKCHSDKGVQQAFARLPRGAHGGPPPAKH